MLSINLHIDDEGTVYVTWIDDTDLMPYLVYSKDGGKTFSPKINIGMEGVNTAMLPNINVKKPGYVAVAYYGSFDEEDGWPISSGYIIPDRRDYNAYLTVTTDLFADTPVFWSTLVNEPDQPVISGMWWNQSEYLGKPAFAPDGAIWAAYINSRTALAVRMTAPPEQDRPSLR